MIYKRLRALLPKQRKLLGLWPGALLTQFGNSMMYLTMFNTLMIVITAWKVTLSALLPIPFWTFIGIIIIAELAIMALDYVFIQPSRIAYGNVQGWAHQSLARVNFEGLSAQIQELKGELRQLTELVERKNEQDK